MNPATWVLAFVISTLSVDEMPSSSPLGPNPSEVPNQKELISPQEEAQWNAWEKEWREEEAKSEEKVLIEWLHVSNSQMPQHKS